MAGPVAVHILIDARACDSPLLDDEAGLERLLTEAVDACNADVVATAKHKYVPKRRKFTANAITIALIAFADVHAVIHTWPGEGRWLADIFTRGRAKPEKGIAVLRQGLGGLVEVTQIGRG